MKHNKSAENVYMIGSAIIIIFIVVSIAYKEGNVDMNKEIEEFQLVAKRFASLHEYNITEYNCINYTEDLKRITDALGFNTRIEIGCHNETGNWTCHEYLQLAFDIEPITGSYVDYQSKYPNYRQTKDLLNDK